jgi:hypothetical protein
MMPFCPAFLQWHALCNKSLSLRRIYGSKAEDMLIKDNEGGVGKRCLEEITKKG